MITREFLGPLKFSDAVPVAAEKTPIALIAPQKDKTLGFREESRDTFTAPEYDFPQIVTIEDTEAYFARANEKKANLMFKEGWAIMSRNEESQIYINQRLAEIEQAQQKPWGMLLKSTGSDLFRFSNAMWVKVRNRNASTGRVRTLVSPSGVRTQLEPIAAYFQLPIDTIEIKRDDSGKITRIKQVMPDGRTKEFPASDIIHFYINKKVGWSVGTPGVIPVIDDIRTLRRIEENIDLLVHQNLFPLFQYKVGTEDRPAQTYPDGTTEIDVVRTSLSYMPPEGVLVTPERHEVSLIGSEGRALRAENYLNHFKIRVFGGLSMSTVDYGEGSTVNRATASTLSGQLIDSVKAVQADFEAQFNFFVLKEILLEGPMGVKSLLPENIAFLRFNEVDIEKKIQLENHAADVYTKHLLTEDEARLMIGYDKIAVDDTERRASSYMKLVEEPMLQLKGAGDPTSPLASAAAMNPATSMEPSDVDAAQGNAKALKPKPAPKKDAFQDHLIAESYNILIKDLSFKIQIQSTKSELDMVVDLWGTQLVNRFSSLISRRFTDGVNSLQGDPWDSYHLTYRDTSLDLMKNTIHRLTTHIKNSLNQNTKSNELMGILDIGLHRLNAIYDTELATGFNLGRLSVLTQRGVKSITTMSSNTDCQVCNEKKTKTINLMDVTLDIVPPHHPNCTCVVIEGV